VRTFLNLPKAGCDHPTSLGKIIIPLLSFGVKLFV
jgi:hypothetical protein